MIKEAQEILLEFIGVIKCSHEREASLDLVVQNASFWESKVSPRRARILSYKTLCVVIL